MGTCGLTGLSKAKLQVVSVGLCCLLPGRLCPLPLTAQGWYLVVRGSQLGGLALGHEPGTCCHLPPSSTMTPRLLS